MTWDIDIDMLQPWSTPVMKTKLRSDVLQTMTELSSQVLADKDAVNWGPNLAGQIGSEPLIDHNILNGTKMVHLVIPNNGNHKSIIIGVLQRDSLCLCRKAATF